MNFSFWLSLGIWVNPLALMKLSLSHNILSQSWHISHQDSRPFAWVIASVTMLQPINPHVRPQPLRLLQCSLTVHIQVLKKCDFIAACPSWAQQERRTTRTRTKCKCERQEQISPRHQRQDDRHSKEIDRV